MLDVPCVFAGNNQFKNMVYFHISGLLLLLYRPTDPIFFINLPAKLEIKLVSPYVPLINCTMYRDTLSSLSSQINASNKTSTPRSCFTIFDNFSCN